MNIIDNLNNLANNIDAAKFKLAKNLKNKGVQALPSDKLDVLADKIVDIPSGSCNLQELNVTENGTYTPQAGDIRGYNKVIVNVPSSGSDMYGFDSIGYDGSETAITDGVKYAKQIEDTWNPNETNLNYKFQNDKNLVFLPKNLDVSKATSAYYMYNYTTPLFVENLSFDSLTNASNMFRYTYSKLFRNLNFPKLTKCNNMFSYAQGKIEDVNINCKTDEDSIIFTGDGIETIKNINITQDPTSTSELNAARGCIQLKEMTGKINIVKSSYLFYGCKELLSTPIINIDKFQSSKYDRWFYDCKKMNKIIFEGDSANLNNWIGDGDVFSSLPIEGEMIFDIRYDYKNILNQININGDRNWTMKPNIEVTNCKELSITADDCIGNDTTTTVHYTATIDGRNIITNEIVTDYVINSDGVSEPFEKNPSLTDSRQITVTFNFYGKTATTTITQSPRIPASTTVDLKENWELAPSETVPNPDPNVYEGVYQSIHKGQENVKDIMTISIIDMPNFELYIRSNAESNYDYVYAGKIDEIEPTEYVTTKGNQQAGTDLASYTKVEYPNDGGRHTISVVYKKDTSGESGDDRGYVFFKKPI